MFTPQMGLLGSAVAFVGTHFLMSPPLRAPMVRAMGEKAFRGIYSLVSLITFGAMIYFYHAIGREMIMWTPGDLLWLFATLLMWLGSILFGGSFVGNPAGGSARSSWGSNRSAQDYPPSDDVGFRALGNLPPDRRWNGESRGP